MALPYCQGGVLRSRLPADTDTERSWKQSRIKRPRILANIDHILEKLTAKPANHSRSPTPPGIEYAGTRRDVGDRADANISSRIGTIALVASWCGNTDRFSPQNGMERP